MPDNCNGRYGGFGEGSGLHWRWLTDPYPSRPGDARPHYQRHRWTNRWARSRQCQEVSWGWKQLSVMHLRSSLGQFFLREKGMWHVKILNLDWFEISRLVKEKKEHYRFILSWFKIYFLLTVFPRTVSSCLQEALNYCDQLILVVGRSAVLPNFGRIIRLKCSARFDSAALCHSAEYSLLFGIAFLLICNIVHSTFHAYFLKYITHYAYHSLASAVPIFFL